MLPFQDLRALAANTGFSVFAARRGSLPVVVVRPSARADVSMARAALAVLASSHARVDHPRVAKVLEARLDEDVPYVSFGLDVVASGLDVAARLARSGRRLTYAAGDGFVLTLRETLEAAHAAEGGPQCIGRLSLGNLFFDARGSWRLVGLGHNVVTSDEHGRPDPRVRSFQAPELLAGAPPTPMGDYVALLQLVRSIVEHVEMPSALARVLTGAPTSPLERLLVRWVRYTEQRVLGELPARRPTLGAALRAAQHIRALLGAGVDRRGLEHLAADVLNAAAPFDDPPEHWRVAADARFVLHRGVRIPLRGPGRAVFVALLDHALWDRGRAVDVWTLFSTAWPDEPFHYERNMNRVHATISRLRKAGLAPLLERADDGYRLAPNEVVVRAPGLEEA